MERAPGAVLGLSGGQRQDRVGDWGLARMPGYIAPKVGLVEGKRRRKIQVFRGECRPARSELVSGNRMAYLVLVALPTGGRSGDKFDTGATAPKAPVAASTEAGAPEACTQAVPTTGGEGVAAAPTETQASTSKAAATSVATGNSGGNHSCRKRGDMVRTKSRREDTWGVLTCAPKSWGRDCGQIR